MKITTKLRNWLAANCGISESASETLCRSVLAEAIRSGKLTLEKVAELSGPSGELTTERKKKLLARLAKDLHEAGELDDAKSIAALADDDDDGERLVHSEAELDAMEKATDAMFSANKWRLGIGEPPAGEPEPSANLGTSDTEKERKNMKSTTPFTATDVFLAAERSAGRYHDAGDGDFVRVKGANERLSTRHATAKHAKWGCEMVEPTTKQLCHTPSEYELAKTGAFAKWLARKSGDSDVILGDLERQCLDDLFTKDRWCGVYDGRFEAGVTPDKVKALLDDGTSGGSNLMPEYFDANIIMALVLHGELFPLVDVVNIPRGSAVETAQVGLVTITSGPASGSAMTPFSTTSLVSAITASVYNATVAMEVSRDFLSDAAVDAGMFVTRSISEKTLEWVENQICNGDGTTEPLGIMNAPGTNTFSYSGGTVGGPTNDDYADFLFSVGKQYRKPMDRSRVCFIGNDTTYSRARKIATGVTGDTRFIFGDDIESYNILGHRYCVQNDVGNQSVAFGNLKYYRLWRRQGMNLSVETGGNYLKLRDLALITARSRYAGKVVLGEAFAVSSNAQS